MGTTAYGLTQKSLIFMETLAYDLTQISLIFPKPITYRRSSGISRLRSFLLWMNV